MASQFTMITKSGGTVTAKNDGAVFAMFPDCRLNGCGMSISGTTLTIAAGSMLICGREFYAASASTITVPASGYLIASVSDSALSFSTATAAPTLTQDDINMTGTTYQVIVAVISNGAITKELPRYCRNGGIIFGTSPDAPAGSYADGTLYVQYE